MEQQFPINYFSTIFSSIKIFKNRKQLKWWQIILVIFLLNGLMLMPLSIQLGKINTVDLNQYVSNAIETLDSDIIEKFNRMLNQGEINVPESMQNSAFASDFNTARESLGDESTFIITNEGFLIKEENKPLIEQRFLSHLPLQPVNSINDLVQQLSMHWFHANRLSIILTNFINIWFLMIVDFLGLLFGTAGLFWLTRFGKIFTIRSFNEAFQLSLNAFGLPTLFAMIFGFISKDPNGMILVQSTGYILLLLWVYWKTHFNDGYVHKNKNKV